MRPDSSIAGLLLAAALLLLSIPAVVAEEGDHPLVSRYPGSVLSRTEAEDFAAYSLITSLGEEGTKPAGPRVEGKVTRLFFQNPPERSALEIFTNYEMALEEAGAEMLFICHEAECGPGYASSAWNRFNGIHTASGTTKHYLAAKLQSGGRVAYVAVTVNRRRHQIDIIEVEEMETGRVVVDASALGDALERDGRVVLGGLYFLVDSADLEPESFPALEQVAELLEGRPDLELYVVGHTDGAGTLEHNLDLSRRRAEAVVEALVFRYHIDKARLSAHGVGPLSPVATNRDERGRSENRRVELVQR